MGKRGKKKAKRKALRKQVALENNEEDEELQAKIGIIMLYTRYNLNK